MLRRKRNRKWSMLEAAAGFAGAAIAGKVVEKGWKGVSGKKPPVAPGARGVRWRVALAFAALAGVAVAVSQLRATGAAAAAG
jgi:hypothetical protein